MTAVAWLQRVIPALAKALHQLVDPPLGDTSAPGRLAPAAALEEHRVHHIPLHTHRFTPVVRWVATMS